MIDPYAILNLGRNCSDEEVKAAYRKLAMQFHPDRFGGDEEKFKQINEANEILSSFSKRRQWDLSHPVPFIRPHKPKKTARTPRQYVPSPIQHNDVEKVDLWRQLSDFEKEEQAKEEAAKLKGEKYTRKSYPPLVNPAPWEIKEE